MVESQIGWRAILSPCCRAPLTAEGTGLRCGACRATFPVVAGIPDLRLAEGPFISNEADRRKALALDARKGASFEELVAAYYAMTPEVPPADARRFRAGLAGARTRAAAWMARWEGQHGPGDRGPLLDVGCGTAPLLHVAGPGRPLCGVDVALRWLVIARRGLEEAGIEATLVCAAAEALPFPDGWGGRIAFLSSLEHVTDQRAALREAHRILGPGGRIEVQTPNRHFPGPDPHLGVWGGSWLPASILRRVARRRGALAPVRRLLSAGQLDRALRHAGFLDVRAGPPPDLLAAAGRSLSPVATATVRWFDRCRRLPGLGTLLDGLAPVVEGSGQVPPAEAYHGQG